MEEKRRIFLVNKMDTAVNDEMYDIAYDKTEQYRRVTEGYLIGWYGDVVDSIQPEDVPKDADLSWYLAESVRRIENADAVYFCPEWMKSKECRVIYEFCMIYGIPILDDPESIIGSDLTPYRR